jgi:hypothetical protein
MTIEQTVEAGQQSGKGYGGPFSGPTPACRTQARDRFRRKAITQPPSPEVTGLDELRASSLTVPRGR